ncbi:hypothetical protein D3C85_1733030 [compost metagenome]
MAGVEQRHRQRADKLDGQRHAEGDALDGQIEEQVHGPKGESVRDGPQQGAPVEGGTPDAKHQGEEEGGAPQPE